jgi:hypothetical protein
VRNVEFDEDLEDEGWVECVFCGEQILFDPEDPPLAPDELEPLYAAHRRALKMVGGTFLLALPFQLHWFFNPLPCVTDPKSVFEGIIHAGFNVTAPIFLWALSHLFEVWETGRWPGSGSGPVYNPFFVWLRMVAVASFVPLLVMAACPIYIACDKRLPFWPW